jgi:hypothetical protein
MGATRGAETPNSSRAPEYTPRFYLDSCYSIFSFLFILEPEEIRKSQLNDNKLNSYTTVYQIKKEKPNGNQASPIKIEGQTTQWAKKNGQTYQWYRNP